MTYEAEAMSPVEVEVSSPWSVHFNKITNDEARTYELHLREERMDASQVKYVMYQRKMTHYYNAKVRN